MNTEVDIIPQENKKKDLEKIHMIIAAVSIVLSIAFCTFAWIFNETQYKFSLFSVLSILSYLVTVGLSIYLLLPYNDITLTRKICGYCFIFVTLFILLIMYVLMYPGHYRFIKALNKARTDLKQKYSDVLSRNKQFKNILHDYFENKKFQNEQVNEKFLTIAKTLSYNNINPTIADINNDIFDKLSTIKNKYNEIINSDVLIDYASNRDIYDIIYRLNVLEEDTNSILYNYNKFVEMYKSLKKLKLDDDINIDYISNANNNIFDIFKFLTTEKRQLVNNEILTDLFTGKNKNPSLFIIRALKERLTPTLFKKIMAGELIDFSNIRFQSLDNNLIETSNI